MKTVGEGSVCWIEEMVGLMIECWADEVAMARGGEGARMML